MDFVAENPYITGNERRLLMKQSSVLLFLVYIVREDLRHIPLKDRE